MKVNIGPYPDYNHKTKRIPERKVKIEIDKYDSWNADHTLALIIHPVMKQLLDTKIGSGHVDDSDVPENIRSTSAKPKKHTWDTDEFWHDRSHWILTEIVWAFEQIIKNNATEEVDSAGEFVAYRREDDPHFRRVQNGLRLFGKYYFSFWD